MLLTPYYSYYGPEGAQPPGNSLEKQTLSLPQSPGSGTALQQSYRAIHRDINVRDRLQLREHTTDLWLCLVPS